MSIFLNLLWSSNEFFSTTVILITIVSLLAIVYLLLVYQRNNASYAELTKLFPGPKTVPYFGNSLELLKIGQASSQKLMHYIEEYNSKPFRLWIGSELFIVLSNPEDIQVATKYALGKPKLFTAFKNAYGDCLFTLMEEERFKFRRKQFAHLFTKRAVSDYSATIEKRIRSEIEVFKRYANTGKIFNSWDHIPFVTFDIMTKTMMDIELDHRDKQTVKFHDVNKQSLNVSGIRFLNPLSRNKYLDALLFGNIKFLSRTMFEFIRRIVDPKIKEIKEMYIRGNETADKKDNPAGRYLEAVYNLSLREKDPSIVYYEMLLITSAGTDTTAIVISYILLMLSIHIKIQEKVFDEQYKIFKDDDREIRQEDLQQMVYTEQVINETLRHLTVIPYVFRYTEKEIKFNDFILPADTNIMLFIFGAHYNPDNYPEPHRFDPDNFSSDAVKSRPKYAFIPFVTGFRDCIGRKFAMMETKIIVSSILRKYRFSTNYKIEDVKLVRSFLSHVSDNYYPLIIEERKFQNV